MLAEISPVHIQTCTHIHLHPCTHLHAYIGEPVHIHTHVHTSGALFHQYFLVGKSTDASVLFINQASAALWWPLWSLQAGSPPYTPHQ
jgi:hypothetical protein